MASDPQFSLEMEIPTEDEMRSDYKRMVHSLAGGLSEEQLKQVRYLKSIKSEDKALQVLESLEQRGEFSFSDIAPLEALMMDIPRVDLVRDVMGPYKEKYSQFQAAESRSQQASAVPLHHCRPQRHTIPTRSPRHQPSPSHSLRHTATYHTQPQQVSQRENLALSSMPASLTYSSQRTHMLTSVEPAGHMRSSSEQPVPEVPGLATSPVGAQCTSFESQSPTLHEASLASQQGSCLLASATLSVQPSSTDRNDLSAMEPAHSQSEPVLSCQGGQRAKVPKMTKSEAAFTVARKKMYKIICKHKQSSTVPVKEKIYLNVNALNEQPQIELKVLPFVKYLDYDAALVVTVIIPPKCTRKQWLLKHSKTSIKISGLVKNMKNAKTIHTFKHPKNEHEEVIIDMERLEFTIPQFLPHHPIFYEDCPKFRVELSVELFQHGNEQEFSHAIGEEDDFVHVDLKS